MALFDYVRNQKQGQAGGGPAIQGQEATGRAQQAVHPALVAARPRQGAGCKDKVRGSRETRASHMACPFAFSGGLSETKPIWAQSSQDVIFFFRLKPNTGLVLRISVTCQDLLHPVSRHKIAHQLSNRRLVACSGSARRANQGDIHVQYHRAATAANCRSHPCNNFFDGTTVFCLALPRTASGCPKGKRLASPWRPDRRFRRRYSCVYAACCSSHENAQIVIFNAAAIRSGRRIFSRIYYTQHTTAPT